MKMKRCRVALMATATVGVVAVTVYAVTTVAWDHPCPSPQALTCEPLPPLCGKPPNEPCPTPDCWCEGDFNDDDHWTVHAPDGDIAQIVHSHDSVSNEKWLEMAAYTTNVVDLEILTDDTGGDDSLDIRLTGGGTIVVSGEVLLDATDGRIELTCEGGSIAAH